MNLVDLMREQFGRTYKSGEVSEGLLMKAYGFILREIYGLDLAFELPFSWVSFRDVDSTIPVQCPQTGITRRLSIDFDSRFVRVSVVGDKPELAREEVEALAGDPKSLPRLLEESGLELRRIRSDGSYSPRAP